MRKPVAKAALSGLGLLIALGWVFPVYWMWNSSLLSNHRLLSFTPTFIPTGGSLANYKAIFERGTFFEALWMSLAITLLAVGACILFAFFAALAISRFRFRGRTSFVVAVLIIQMLPAEGLFIAQYKLMQSIGGLERIWGVSLLYAALVVPFTIWMLRGFVAGVPVELEEAATVDGLSRTGAFFRITFPLLAPGLVASGVYGFLQAWNEYTLALVVMTDPAQRTLPLWLQGLVEANRATDWGLVMAGATLIALPVIGFFLVVQHRMTAGLVAGAVKG